MNEFDNRYNIRLANKDDIDNIMYFIGKYWKKGHILSRDYKYFEFEFREGDNVNFILAIDKESGNIEALLGFLKASKDTERLDVWGSIWKVNSEHDNMQMLGVELQKRVKKITGCRYHNRIGMNPHTAVPIVRLYLGSIVKKMNHYYILNDKIDNYLIAGIEEKKAVKNELISGGFYLMKTFEELCAYVDINKITADTIPYKEEWYVKHKFYDNPKRYYIIYGIESNKNNGSKAFFVARECEYENRKVLRILDYYGEQETLVYVGRNLVELMYEKEYEYIDFYNYGFNDEYLMKAGFCLRDKEDKNIIPNYFEPFEKKNVDIWISYEKEGMCFYKADGDQDRANC